jgi:DNA repair protein RadD
LQLRPYQTRTLDALRAEFQAGRRSVVVVSPTGSGKGSMAAHMLAQAVKRGRRGLFIVHRREIILDVAERIAKAAGLRPGIILAGHPYDPRIPLQVASIETLRNRKKPAADLLIWDECHHAICEGYQEVKSFYSDAYHAGFTATPARHDGRGLAEAFEAIVLGPTVSELISEGHLTPFDIISPDHRLEERRTIAADPVAAYLEHAPGKTMAVYASNLKEAQRFAQEFTTAGIRAVCIEGASAKDARAQALRDIAAGRLSVVTNCNVLTEGTDIPSLDGVIVARGVGSCALWLQICGRALRTHPAKEKALILDLPGNVHVHGPPDEEREYSLEGRGIRRKSDAAPLLVCAICGGERKTGRCKRCGFEPETKETEIDPQPLVLYERPATREDGARALQRMVAFASHKGLHTRWVWHEYVRAFGAEPPAERWEEIKKWIAAERERCGVPIRPPRGKGENRGGDSNGDPQRSFPV